jgi:hypothetical protein
MAILCIIKTHKDFLRITTSHNQQSSRVYCQRFSKENGWVDLERSPRTKTIFQEARRMVDHLERVYERQIREIVPYESMGPATEQHIRERLRLGDREADPEIDMTEIEPPTDK